jgi:hypothetical protein
MSSFDKMSLEFCLPFFLVHLCKNKQLFKNYFFDDTPEWKSSNRRFETIEASILFEEEEEEEKYTEEDKEQPKQWKHYIPEQNGYI